jgi:hypothetical protein
MRALLFLAVLGWAAAAGGAQGAPELGTRVGQLVSGEEVARAHWGISVVDAGTGEKLWALGANGAIGNSGGGRLPAARDRGPGVRA